MFSFRKRFISQGITWEQLVFQFLIVLLGVYLAISFENRAAERGRIEDAHEMLGRVLEELRLDEAEIREVIAGAEEMAVGFDSLSTLMGTGSNSYGEEISSLIYGPLYSARTVFPRKAAYETMVSGGYLTAIPDHGLAARLADHYEHWHARIENTGNLADRANYDAWERFTSNWDMDRSMFTDPGLPGTTLARNAMRTWKDVHCDWYAGIVLPDFLIAVTEIRIEIDEYLAG